MACDGLWDVMSNQEVVDYILEEFDKLKKNKAADMALYALKKGSTDNVSVIIIEIE